ncbi:efflux RND transporter periplasmic adaptor subunit [Gloeobacter kilaueensis]|uniref:RND family efflux transporter MFP subunit n=1 Tax=Gloeobacter kilaueensis (strain ATCC BAA-2537 / CCAP 1431/1 / ULC 316 / JS1) TaxID=1183438 RepID=U5QIP5_GLOK1|nr:efflux RND transporter periplasmic adaptor subunit [Gloeobacter kilaueensis]AGY58763.1 RND family efflux transporter MFP subunit [Gloeobacter kilaueensis JS1]
MDIPRSKPNQTTRRVRLALFTLAASAAVVLLVLGLSNLKPAAPTVDRSTVWIDTVRRGTLIRQVRGLGTLVPEQISWIPATTEGRVEKIYVRPGARVQPDTVLLVLSNPEVQQTAVDAQLQLKAAEAEYANLQVQLASSVMGQRATLATVQSDYRQAVLQGAANEELASKGLIPRLQAQLSKVKTEELASRQGLEQQRLAIAADAARAQLAVQTSKIEQLRTLVQLRNSRVDSLKVRAGLAGVLQQLPLDIGQRVTPGTNLARVADPRTLKAELKIAETQAKDIQLGQPASVDTHNGTVTGTVARIDPAVQNGTVTVDVRLMGSLPAGARPDLSVDGTIELERLRNVLFVGRPAFGQENQTVGLFKLDAEGTEASRVPVRLGKSSVNTIEVLSGLREGERVILSDMSAQESYNRIRLQ